MDSSSSCSPTPTPRTKMEREHWLLCALIAVPFLYYLTSILRPRSGSSSTGSRRLPPGPRPLPLLGNLLDLRGGNGNLHHALARLARVHGPVMRLRLGLTTAVVVSSRDAAREAFTRHDRALSARTVPDALRAAGYSERSIVWLPSSDPRWKALRGVVAAHVFTRRSLDAGRGVRERKARDLVGYLRRRSGQEVDVGQAVYGGVVNLVSSALFSVDVIDDVAAESARGLRELVVEIVDAITKPNVSDFFPFLRPLDLQGWRRCTARRFDDLFRMLDGLLDRRLSDAAADDASPASSQQGDFLDILLELLSAGKITRDNATGILFDVFVGGSGRWPSCSDTRAPWPRCGRRSGAPSSAAKRASRSTTR